MKNYTINWIRLIGAGLLFVTFVMGVALTPYPPPDVDRIILTLALCFCFLIFALVFERKQD